MLVSNRNLLVIADVLAVNRGFAKANPEMVRGLVHGILEGNRRAARSAGGEHRRRREGVRLDAKTDARDELARVHLANLPENRAFFAGTIDSAGSFGGIFQSSVLAYGERDQESRPTRRASSTRAALDALAKKGLFADQKIAIAPIRTATQALARRRSAAQQGHPLLLRSRTRRRSTRTRRRTWSISTRSSASCR